MLELNNACQTAFLEVILKFSRKFAGKFTKNTITERARSAIHPAVSGFLNLPIK